MGDKVVFVAFGAGCTSGAVALEWTADPANGARDRLIPLAHPQGDGPVLPAVSGSMVIEQRGAAIAAFGPV